MVSMSVLVILMVLIAEVMGQVQRAWGSASSRVSQFREARRAFDRISRNLSQASLNTYIQYVYSGSGNPILPPTTGSIRPAPAGYARYSELQFICGETTSLLGGSANEFPGHAVFFQAPLGTNAMNLNLPSALNPVGYFVEHGSDTATRPTFLEGKVPDRWRYRLMEYRAPTENNIIYDQSELEKQVVGGSSNGYWFKATKAEYSRPVAENIAILVISPRLPTTDSTDPVSIAPYYQYNSAANGLKTNQDQQDYQMPPLIQITMVAIDEVTASRLSEKTGSTPPLKLDGYFSNASESARSGDFKALQTYLTSQRVNFRIFTTTIAIRNSKWGSGKI